MIVSKTLYLVTNKIKIIKYLLITKCTAVCRKVKAPNG